MAKRQAVYELTFRFELFTTPDSTLSKDYAPSNFESAITRNLDFQ